MVKENYYIEFKLIEKNLFCNYKLDIQILYDLNIVIGIVKNNVKEDLFIRKFFCVIVIFQGKRNYVSKSLF